MPVYSFLARRRKDFGWWRSLVAHLTGGQGVAGSNTVHPTRIFTGQKFHASGLYCYLKVIMSDSFFIRCYSVVRQIPVGRVASYGQVARLLGEPRRARYVGFAMHSSPGVAGGVPCHRVVFKDGSLAPGFAFGGPDAQRALLESEGVGFLPDGRVDMKRFVWEAGID